MFFRFVPTSRENRVASFLSTSPKVKLCEIRIVKEPKSNLSYVREIDRSIERITRLKIGTKLRNDSYVVDRFVRRILDAQKKTRKTTLSKRYVKLSYRCTYRRKRIVIQTYDACLKFLKVEYLSRDTRSTWTYQYSG